MRPDLGEIPRLVDGQPPVNRERYTVAEPSNLKFTSNINQHFSIS
jgi:hypothetical protein